MALIPYTFPKAPMEFICSEVERGLKIGIIKPEQLDTVSKIIRATPKVEASSSLTFGKVTHQAAGDLDFYIHLTLDLSQPRVGLTLKLNGDEIAEVLQAEVGFTLSTDKKPVLATYACASCIGLGGYDPTNKMAFLVHFSTVKEVRQAGQLIFHHISKLAKKKFETPIQLHLRGGVKGLSEDIIEAIKIWMKASAAHPMEILSENVFDYRNTSLSIDSRTGAVSGYDPMANPKSRNITEFDAFSALFSAFEPRIKLVYTPNA